MANNGPHLIDTARFLLSDLAALSVECRHTPLEDLIERSLPCEESAVTEIEFAGGIRGEFETGHPDPGPLPPRSARRTRLAHRNADFLNGERRQANVLRRKGLSPASPPVPPVCRVGEGKASGLRCRRSVVRRNRGTGSRRVRVDAHRRPREPAAGEPRRRHPAGHPRFRRIRFASRGRTKTNSAPAPSRATSPDGRLAIDGGRQSLRRWFSSDPFLGLAEMKNLAAVIRGKNLNRVGGAAVPQLEEEFAAFYGSPCAVASTSGTSAIHVAPWGLRIPNRAKK